mgnify:CR=1 FL=1
MPLPLWFPARYSLLRTAMRGNIEKRVSDDDYIFRDATGTMKVDIDHKRWEGQNITPKDKVEIQGELDKDFNSVELDVKKIRKLN